MTPSSQHPEELVDFVSELRRNGYRIGTEQYIAAQRLLIALAALGDWPAHSGRLGTMLAPVLCTSRDEQENFFRFYEQWRRSRPGLFTQTKEIEEVRGTRKPVESQPGKIRERTIPPSRINWWIWLVPLGIALATIILVPLVSSPPTKLTQIEGTVFDHDARALSGASVWLRRGGEQITRVQTITDSNGHFSLAYPDDFPNAVLTIDKPDYQSATLEITVNQVVETLEVELQRGNLAAQSRVLIFESSRLQRLRRFYQRNKEWTATILVGMIFLCVGLIWLRRFSRVLELKKWRTKNKPRLDNLKVQGAAEQLTRILSLRRTAQELRRRQPDAARDLDIQKTIEETIHNGLFTPAYTALKFLPEYLVLIDQDSFSDQQARLVNEIMARLVKNDVFIERYFFQGDPRICRKADPKAQFETLQDLAARYPEHYLLVFSDGAGLFNPLTGRPEHWLEMFSPWPTRVLLTSEVQAGDYREELLSASGFGVLPANKVGLAALGELAGIGQRQRRVDSSQIKPLPTILQERSGRWLESHPPAPNVLNNLCLQLKSFLVEEVYYWLTACAVYPMLYWELTLYLGYKLVNQDKFDEKFSTLVRLPWFRSGNMPEWLRERLILELSPDKERAIRSALKELLLTSLLRPEGFVLPLARKAEGGESNFLKEAWSRLKARTDRLKNTAFILVFLKSEPENSLLQDYVFLSFMSGRKPNRLALRIPDELRRALYKEEQSIRDDRFFRTSIHLIRISSITLLILFGMVGGLFLLLIGACLIAFLEIAIASLGQLTRSTRELSSVANESASSAVRSKQDVGLNKAFGSIIQKIQKFKSFVNVGMLSEIRSRLRDGESSMVEDVAIAPASTSVFRQVEFYAFCVISFAAKSMLLIRLPYREWQVNTVYTCSLLLFFYCFFRFRQRLRAPIFVVFSLAAAVAVDILGNKFGLYGNPFGPLRDYDEFAHAAGSGFSAIAAFWILRAGTRRMGFRLSGSLLAFLSTSVAFTYCGWYEILELWDELFYGDFERIHWWYDTANDLFYDFLGVIFFISAAALFFALKDRQANAGSVLIPVRFRNLFSTLPKDLLAFLVATAAFGLCAWFEIFRYFDQRWFGRIHLVGNRDTAINLEWELAASIVVAIAVAGISKLPKRAVSERRNS